MSEHTPGPWKILESDSRMEICSDDYGYIAGVTLVPDTPRETVRADFDLIAAAPDMLAALNIAEMILSHSNRLPLEGYDSDMVVIRKAIAKAEGRE